MGQEMFQIFWVEGVLVGMSIENGKKKMGKKVETGVRKLNESYPGSKLRE
jgi:hypothetical protein